LLLVRELALSLWQHQLDPSWLALLHQ